MAHVLVRDWLHRRRRIRGMGRQLVSPKRILHTFPVIDVDRFVNRVPFRMSPALQDTAILPRQNHLHPLPRPTPNRGFVVSL